MVVALMTCFQCMPLGETKKYHTLWRGWSKSWLHPIALERRKENKQRMDDFIAAGELVIVENIGDDVAQAGVIAKRIFLTLERCLNRALVLTVWGCLHL